MGYNILGINTSHHGSVCLLKGGEIELYIEEERLSLKKYDRIPLKSLIYILNNYSINEVAIGSLEDQFNSNHKVYVDLIKKYNPKAKFSFLGNHHHLVHAIHAFSNSGFTNAISLVIDGLGGIKNFPKISPESSYTETESIFECNLSSNFNKIFGMYTAHQPSPSKITDEIDLGYSSNLTLSYQAITNFLGFKNLEAGKTMGLSSYGKYDLNIPKLFLNNRGDKNLFEGYPYFNFNPHPKLFKYFSNNKEWHYNSLKIKDSEKNLAYHIQVETQEIVCNYIKKIIKKTQTNNIVCSGGYFLNCVANYYLKKQFPKINFYFEPLSHDGGTAIGAAQLLWYQRTQDKTIRPQKTIYYGLKYSKEDLLNGIQKYLD
tara:strand:+ start:74 stop:1192 length:1119 start_codon:yes stop_codon:yes gene_type:complete